MSEEIGRFISASLKSEQDIQRKNKLMHHS